jgi:hypothetical protein
VGAIQDLLTAEHRELSRLFSLETIEEFRARLLRHIAQEERVLFPAARRALGGELPGAAVLHDDHAALAALLVPTPTPAILDGIREILETHDALEEGPDGIYAACERAIPEPEREAVLEALRSRPTVPLAAHFDGPAALANVERLLARRSRR